METDRITYKLLVLGDSSVGKSCFILRYTEDTFTENFMPTIGIDYRHKDLKVEGEEIRAQLWDTAGHERFRAITKSLYKGSHGVLLLFDLTSRKTFENVKEWVSDIKNDCGNDTLTLIVGNKSDLPDRQVSSTEAANLAAELKTDYVETSAKEGLNVEEAVQKLLDKVLQNSKVKREALKLREEAAERKYSGMCC